MKEALYEIFMYMYMQYFLVKKITTIKMVGVLGTILQKAYCTVMKGCKARQISCTRHTHCMYLPVTMFATLKTLIFRRLSLTFGIL